MGRFDRAISGLVRTDHIATDHIGSLEELDAAVHEHPHSAEALTARGRTLAAIERMGAAMQDLNKAVVLGGSTALFERGIAAMSSGDHAAGAADLPRNRLLVLRHGVELSGRAGHGEIRHLPGKLDRLVGTQFLVSTP